MTENEYVPPENEMLAGRDWIDPYRKDRKLPADITAERAHMRELVAALESTRSRALRPALLAIFYQHHDPVVLIRFEKVLITLPALKLIEERLS